MESNGVSFSGSAGRRGPEKGNVPSRTLDGLLLTPTPSFTPASSPTHSGSLSTISAVSYPFASASTASNHSITGGSRKLGSIAPLFQRRGIPMSTEMEVDVSPPPPADGGMAALDGLMPISEMALIRRSTSAPHIHLLCDSPSDRLNLSSGTISQTSNILTKRRMSPPVSFQSTMDGHCPKGSLTCDEDGDAPMSHCMESGEASVLALRTGEMRPADALGQPPLQVYAAHIQQPLQPPLLSSSLSPNTSSMGTPTRSRHYSSSSLPGSGGLARTPSRVHQIRQEETPHGVLDRELAHERVVQSSLQIAQSWTDLCLDSMGDTPRRPRCFSESLHIITSPFQCVNSPSPTRAFKKQCFSPSMGAHLNGGNVSTAASACSGRNFTPSPSPSPTRRLPPGPGLTLGPVPNLPHGMAPSPSAAGVTAGAVARRRSNSPSVVLRPSPLGTPGSGIKRKLDGGLDAGYSSPKRMMFGGEYHPHHSTISFNAHSPITRSISTSDAESYSLGNSSSSEATTVRSQPGSFQPLSTDCVSRYRRPDQSEPMCIESVGPLEGGSGSFNRCQPPTSTDKEPTLSAFSHRANVDNRELRE